MGARQLWGNEVGRERRSQKREWQKSSRAQRCAQRPVKDERVRLRSASLATTETNMRSTVGSRPLVEGACHVTHPSFSCLSIHTHTHTHTTLRHRLLSQLLGRRRGVEGDGVGSSAMLT
jgi:hypothetical protein